MCTCSLCTCVFAQSLHVLAKPWGGIIANFSPRTQALPLSPPPFTDLHPSLASAAGHVVMRWELTFIIPCGGHTATNRDLPRRLLMMSMQRSYVRVHPFHPRAGLFVNVLACLTVPLLFSKSPPVAFSLSCWKNESGDRRCTSTDKPTRSLHTMWNSPNWWHLDVIKALLVIQYTNKALTGTALRFYSDTLPWAYMHKLTIPSQSHWCRDEHLNKLKI